MTDDARRRAKAWFDQLDPIPQAFALTMLPSRPTVTIMFGVATCGAISREAALRMIRSGPVRLAPADQPTPLSRHRLVIIGTNGFPVQIETLPSVRKAGS